eukprot:1161518-Pelagomonas_calceolata.AAC.15
MVREAHARGCGCTKVLHIAHTFPMPLAMPVSAHESSVPTDDIGIAALLKKRRRVPSLHTYCSFGPADCCKAP